MFAVLKAAKELKTKERAEFMYDIVGAICSPNLKQTDLNSYLKMWQDIGNSAIPEFEKETVKYKNGRPTIPMKEASQIMLKQLAVMKRLQHGDQ